MKRILLVAHKIAIPPIPMRHTYEVDEMWSFVSNKKNHIWTAYALDRKDRRIVSFNVGGRSSEMLEPILTTLNNSQAKMIYTDHLRQYQKLIPQHIHKRSKTGTNHIERHNLTLRTHLKRLTRKTICFSRSIAVLTAILKIYFWG